MRDHGTTGWRSDDPRSEGKDYLGEGDELLKDKVNSIVSQNHRKIVLNLADVPYLDSAGLGEVVRSVHDREPTGWEPQVAQPNETHHGSAVDHQAFDRVRDLRIGKRRRAEFFGFGQGLTRHRARWRAAPHPKWQCQVPQSPSTSAVDCRQPSPLASARTVDEESARVRWPAVRAEAVQSPCVFRGSGAFIIFAPCLALST